MVWSEIIFLDLQMPWRTRCCTELTRYSIFINISFLSFHNLILFPKVSYWNLSVYSARRTRLMHICQDRRVTANYLHHLQINGAFVSAFLFFLKRVDLYSALSLIWYRNESDLNYLKFMHNVFLVLLICTAGNTDTIEQNDYVTVSFCHRSKILTRETRRP